ncbi:MAG: DNA cytosine methyltransferase [Ruminococcus flavefaciens]|nr:DNA cytosine methyltransferase [Ruminococcus flavefaciens]
MQEEILGTIYAEVSEGFQRGICPIARTVKANKYDLAVVTAVRSEDVEEKRLGNIYGFDGGNYAGNVYDKDGLSPTIRTYQGGNQQPMIVENIPCKLNKNENGVFFLTDDFKVCDVGTQTASTICARYYKGLSTHKDNMCIVAMRGRNPNNTSDRTAGSPTEQRLEPNSQGICNAITTVQKDSLVLEKKRVSPNRTHNMSKTRLYNIWKLMKRRCNCPKSENYDHYGGRGITYCDDWEHFEPFRDWAYTSGYSDNLTLDRIDNDRGYSPDNCRWVTLTEQVNNRGVWGEIPYYGIVKDNTGYRAQVTVKGRKVYIAHSVNDIKYLIDKRNEYIDKHNLPCKKNVYKEDVLENICINDRGFSEKEPQVSIGVTPTLRAETHGNLPKVIETQYRIRKLTPLECWRLMGFSDEDFHKAEEVNSNSQLYKQAGNSIVKNVLMAILGQMMPSKENVYKEL